MGRGRVAETERMPRLVEGYTELCCSKLKKGNGFLKPNFELGPSPESAAAIQLVGEIVEVLSHIIEICFRFH